jgi:hypothetical protein
MSGIIWAPSKDRLICINSQPSRIILQYNTSHLIELPSSRVSSLSSPSKLLALNSVEAQSEGADRKALSDAFIYRPYPLPSVASLRCRSSLDLSTNDVATVYFLRIAKSGATRPFRFITSIIPSGRTYPAYLHPRLRRLLGWIVGAGVCHEVYRSKYRSPRDEYQRHHPPAPNSAGLHWPAVL